jgi:hypothetical protein
MIRAWHFVGKALRDGRPVPADGEWLAHDGPLVLCESGLHFSVHPFDALTYAPGETLCLVECDGDVTQEGDKGVCRRRRIVARMDATELLRYFARMQALSVIHLWADPPDVVLDYLMTGDEVLGAAASDAAMAAASAAAWAAARAAAWAAANAAAWAAARAAARAAASDAASAAANAAAWDAARAAASAAASDAASAAASDAARADFQSLVNECFRNVEGGLP